MSVSATPDAAIPSWARAVCAGLSAIGSRELVYVPDNPLSHILAAAALDPGVRTTLVTREEEGFGVAAGLYLGGARPTMLLQSSGLGNSLNALTSLLIPYQIPVLMIVSMRGGPGEWNIAQVPMGEAVVPILRSLGIQYMEPARPDDVEEAVRLTGTLAFSTRTTAAVLLPYALARGLRDAPAEGGAR